MDYRYNICRYLFISFIVRRYRIYLFFLLFLFIVGGGMVWWLPSPSRHPSSWRPSIETSTRPSAFWLSCILLARAGIYLYCVQATTINASVSHGSTSHRFVCKSECLGTVPDQFHVDFGLSGQLLILFVKAGSHCSRGCFQPWTPINWFSSLWFL